MTCPSPLRGIIESEAQGAACTPRAALADRPGAGTGTPPPLEPEWIPWGPELGDGDQPELLATAGSIELEYAALRRGVARMDAAHRGTIELRGADRLDLLDRLLTQKVCALQPGAVAESFLLDRTGRLLGDLVVVHADASTILDVDVHQSAEVTRAIDAMCFGEDVEIVDRSSAMHGIDLYGPEAPAIAAALDMPLTAAPAAVQQGESFAWRLDQLGEPGIALRVPASMAPDVWSAVEGVASAAGVTMRTVGWFALNMARVEASEPMANIDFGTGNLPAETGVLHRRVSFTKGCYPGQEVVARMFNLGHPKQVLRRLVIEDGALPVAGAQVFAGDDEAMAEPRGVVTSSAPAPLSGSRAAALAMLRWALADPGGQVRLVVDGAPLMARVEAIEEAPST